MRAHRTGDDDLVVVVETAIDVHRHVDREKAAAQGVDLFGGQGADQFKGRGMVPLVVDQLHAAVLGAAFFEGDF